MYSVVMMVAMTSGGEAVDFCFRNRGCSSSCTVAVAPVCSSSAPVCTGTVVYSAPVADCCNSSHGCCSRPGLFSRLFHKNDCCSAPAHCHGANDCCSGGGFLSRLFHRNNNCCSAPCSAPVVVAPCSGTVVVPAGCTAH